MAIQNGQLQWFSLYIIGGLHWQTAMVGYIDGPQWQIEMEALYVICDGLDLRSKLHWYWQSKMDNYNGCSLYFSTTSTKRILEKKKNNL